MSGLLLRALAGWRQIRIKGGRAEHLVSRLIAEGYRLWKVERRGNELWALISEEGFEVLAQLAQELGVELITARRGGLPFRWRQIRQRPFLLLGFVSAWLIVLYATSHVWAIKVTEPNLPPSAQSELIRAAGRAGLKIGANERRLNIPDIRRKMLSRLPEYSWIGIHIKGMVAVIDGIRFVKRPPDHLPPRLVATRSGKVTAIFVYMGAADVLVGEQVQKGQSLISGVVTEVAARQPNDAKKPVEESVLTPAEGEVRADVTYQQRLFQPFVAKRLVKTGHKRHRRFVQFEGGGMLAIPSLSPIPFTHYTVEKNVRDVSFAGVGLPVRVIDLVYNEEVIHTVRLNRREAVQRGRIKALVDLRKKVPKNGQRVGSIMAVSYAKDGVWVTQTWIINCNIAAPPA